MERPGDADQRVKQPAILLNVEEQSENAVAGDDDQAVEREEIRRERDPEIVAVGHDVAAFPADAKPADPPSHEQDPKGMRQLVAEYVNDHRTRQSEECDQPENRAQGEEPEFGARPKTMGHSRPGENGEEGLRENAADREEKNRDNEFNPPGRNHPRALG